MSELDAERRERLVERIGGAGQSVITTTDLAHVPGAGAPGVVRLRGRPGHRGDGRDAGARRMRRREPRPAGHAVAALADRLAPLTLLADVQRVWPRAVGEIVAAQAEPDG